MKLTLMAASALAGVASAASNGNGEWSWSFSKTIVTDADGLPWYTVTHPFLSTIATSVSETVVTLTETHVSISMGHEKPPPATVLPTITGETTIITDDEVLPWYTASIPFLSTVTRTISGKVVTRTETHVSISMGHTPPATVQPTITGIPSTSSSVAHNGPPHYPHTHTVATDCHKTKTEDCPATVSTLIGPVPEVDGRKSKSFGLVTHTQSDPQSSTINDSDVLPTIPSTSTSSHHGKQPPLQLHSSSHTVPTECEKMKNVQCPEFKVMARTLADPVTGIVTHTHSHPQTSTIDDSDVVPTSGHGANTTPSSFRTTATSSHTHKVPPTPPMAYGGGDDVTSLVTSVSAHMSTEVVTSTLSTISLYTPSLGHGPGGSDSSITYISIYGPLDTFFEPATASETPSTFILTSTATRPETTSSCNETSSTSTLVVSSSVGAEGTTSSTCSETSGVTSLIASSTTDTVPLSFTRTCKSIGPSASICYETGATSTSALVASSTADAVGTTTASTCNETSSLVASSTADAVSMSTSGEFNLTSVAASSTSKTTFTISLPASDFPITLPSPTTSTSTCDEEVTGTDILIITVPTSEVDTVLLTAETTSTTTTTRSNLTLTTLITSITSTVFGSSTADAVTAGNSSSSSTTSSCEEGPVIITHPHPTGWPHPTGTHSWSWDTLTMKPTNKPTDLTPTPPVRTLPTEGPFTLRRIKRGGRD